MKQTTRKTRPKKSKAKNANKKVDGYRHDSKERPNIPTEQTSKYMEEEDKQPTTYKPKLRSRKGPLLSWDRDSNLEDGTQASPLYIREKIHPSAFAASLEKRDGVQTKLFGSFDGLDRDAAFQWYKHRGNWQNRIIHGESRRVMASLLAKESMAGKIQMIYFDPPYGINFKTTMQGNARRRNVKKGEDELPNDPVHLGAFRDTYKNGIHSYMDNLYHMAIHARALLTTSGSFLLQIGSANVHRAAIILDEVFGAENRIATITFAKAGATSTDTLPQIADHILWYANDRENVLYHQFYEKLLNRKDILDHMSWLAKIETKSGKIRKLTSAEKSDPDAHIPNDCRLYDKMPLISQGESTTGRSEPYVYNNKTFHCPPNLQWSVSAEGLDRLAKMKRLDGDGQSLRWKRYEDEIPGKQINNIWGKRMSADDLHYVVETAESVIERCILMTTNPGDLVMDPTCGSGTTAFVAERWGRRWITSDSSIVAVTLARQRIVTGTYDYYVLRDSLEGSKTSESSDNILRSKDVNYKHDPSKGFVYETVNTVSAATLAYDREPIKVDLINRPLIDESTIRISSPFTVESHSPYRYVDPESFLFESKNNANTDRPYVTEVLSALKTSGMKSGKGIISVDGIVEYPSKNEGLITHTAFIDGEKGGIMIAPDDCTVPATLIDRVADDAVEIPGVRRLAIIAFAFEPDVRSNMSEKRGKLIIHRVQANQDLLVGNLKDDNKDTAFVVIGEPDVDILDVSKDKNKIKVKVSGYDTYDPKTRQIQRGTSKEIICWMIDTEYDGKSFFARKIHFPECGSDKQIKQFQKSLEHRIDGDLWKSMLSYESVPFPRPKTERIAVRIITETHTEMTIEIRVKANRRD